MLSKRIILFLLLDLCIISKVWGRLWRFFCDISQEEIRVVATQDGTKFFFIDGEVPPGNERHLFESSLQYYTKTEEGSLRGHGLVEGSSWIDAIPIKRLAAQDDATTDSYDKLITEEVRQCSCADSSDYKGTNFYCILPFSHCAIPSSFWSQNLIPGCINRDNHDNIAKGIWPVVAVFYGFMLLCLFCTRAGRGVLHYMFGKVYPPWTRRQVEHLLRHDPGRTNMLIRRYCQRRRREMQRELRQADVAATTAAAQPVFVRDSIEDSLPPAAAPTSLALKTRIYTAAEESPSKNNKKEPQGNHHHHDHDSDFGDHEATCTICFGPLHDGCRVGALPCDHIFHVDCLKTWLARRNVCPLCQVPNVASPRYSPTPEQVHSQDVDAEGEREDARIVNNQEEERNGGGESESNHAGATTWRQRARNLGDAVRRGLS